MQLEHQDRIAVMRMEAGKANAMGPAFLAGVESLWEEFRASDARALVLTGYGRFFCAGLDLVTLSAFGRDEMRGFMGDFHRVMMGLFTCDRPIVAAINGHAIAGGCVLALQADWRVLAAGSARIGLNESQLGVGLPVVAVESLRARLPRSSWLPVALEGRIFEPEHARELGLANEIAPPERVESRALERARELARIPRPAWSQIDGALTARAVAAIERSQTADAEAWLDTWFSDAARERVAAAVDALRSKAS